MSKIEEMIIESESKLEDFSLCSLCKGECCKKSPCAYIPSDLSMKPKDIKKLLVDKKISIVSQTIVGVFEGRLETAPLLTIESRGINKGPIDLFDVKTTCSLLTDSGCSLEKKPAGALLLIPGSSGYYEDDENRCKSLLEGNENLFIEEWLEHQSMLKKIVESTKKEKFELLYRRAVLNMAKLVNSKYPDIPSNVIEHYNLLNIMGILKNIDKLSMATSIKYVDNLVINHEKPNEERIRELIK